MTTVIAWYGADSKKLPKKDPTSPATQQLTPASLYFASDSRISWEEAKRPYPKWDFAKKVFASRATPDIFAFSGSVETGVVLLSQVVSLADHGLLFSDADRPWRRFRKFYFAILRTWEKYPVKKMPGLSFLHGFRIGEGVSSRFFVGVMRWSVESEIWKRDLIPCPVNKASGVLDGIGTGHQEALKWIEIRNRTNEANTSRAMFSGLCDSILAESDPDSGGAPQLVGLYRKSNASSFGIIWEGQRYFDGQPLHRGHVNDTLEWRNAIFERVDGKSGLLLPGAQAHAVR
ncbi:hypothetical protein KPA93_17745 [Burkholderia cenocepacia]|uniref:hypothetical protein n=1 Tax=Burkholderia cenocepacia TaxID=95486 RepID=UPI00285BAF67|nr:hypothetical protein [Burkholderia cenocepacia]MDR8029522.1 hypothetical protein [Burkholderia cenocepacia]MDR8042337.1 hypothetical protein [Burkholderia cenocepacia]